MKRKKIIQVAIIILIFIFHSDVLAATTWLKIREGDTFPDIQIPAPANVAHRNYLGLKDEGSFSIQDIDAEVLIIQIYFYACPKCQGEAPTINKLYRYLENHRKTKGKVKLIGIAVGDDIYDVKIFAKEFKVRFPLFPDEKYIIKNKLGAEGTPIFIGVKIRNGGNSKVFYTHIGPIKRAKTVLYDIIKKAGLK